MVLRLEILCSLRFSNLLLMSDSGSYSDYVDMYNRCFCVLLASKLYILKYSIFGAYCSLLNGDF